MTIANNVKIIWNLLKIELHNKSCVLLHLVTFNNVLKPPFTEEFSNLYCLALGTNQFWIITNQSETKHFHFIGVTMSYKIQNAEQQNIVLKLLQFVIILFTIIALTIMRQLFLKGIVKSLNVFCPIFPKPRVLHRPYNVFCSELLLFCNISLQCCPLGQSNELQTGWF